MRLLVFSDLHLEHRPSWEIPCKFPDYDVAVLAGDIGGSPAASLKGLAKEPGLAGRPIVFVAGNHEFCGDAIEPQLEQARALADPRVNLLDSTMVVIDGVRVIGATLWTAYDVGDHAACERGIADHRLIRDFRTADALARHRDDLAAIERMLSQPFDGRTVVVTHHAPSHRSIARKFRGAAENGAFVSDLENVMHRYQPDLWIHGHVHSSHDYRVGRTRVLCNPKGYGPHHAKGITQENRRFDPKLVVTL